MKKSVLATAEVSCVVCTTPRSGSWLLSSAMQQSGVLGTPEEYFRPDVRLMWSVEWGISAKAPYGVYVRHAIDYGTTDNGVFSVKLHWPQMEWFLQRLRRIRDAGEPDGELLATWLPRPRYVYLHRRDSAAQAVSFYRAARSGLWFQPAGDASDAVAERLAASRLPPSDDEWAYVRFLEDRVTEGNEAWLGFFEDNAILPLEIAYEDFAADYSGTLGRVVEYVGAGIAADVAHLTPALVRQADERNAAWKEQYLARRDSVVAKPLPTTHRLPTLRRD
jgi:LPS sulfotransferase NodH